MSTTVSETVSVDRKVLMEAVAHLFAANDVLIALNDGVDSDAGLIFEEAGIALQHAAFGRIGDASWRTDPVQVELTARGQEIAADVLEMLFPPMPRIEAYRDSARRMRERGTIDVPFGGDDA